MDGALIFADILRTRAGIVSRPADFDTLRLLRSVITSCSMIARSLNNVFRWGLLLVSLSALFPFNRWVSISEANLEPISTKKSLNVSVMESSSEIVTSSTHSSVMLLDIFFQEDYLLKTFGGGGGLLVSAHALILSQKYFFLAKRISRFNSLRVFLYIFQ